jgi:hypothetical protein
MASQWSANTSQCRANRLLVLPNHHKIGLN